MNRRLKEVIGDYSMASTRRAEAPGNLRGSTSLSAGRPVRGSLGSILDIDAEETNAAYQRLENLQKVAVVYVKNDEGKVLAVSRFGDTNNMNLPGGHVESNESIEAGAVRELYEETGIIAPKLYPIHSEVVDSGYYVTAYYAPEWRGKLRSSNEGTAAWVDPDMVLGSQYGKFFAAVLDKLEGVID
jgi:8-oxo-dGTP pyrophosphatase MutT (NUDIX family)